MTSNSNTQTATRPINRNEAWAKARVRALSEGVRVHLLSNELDEVRYSCPSTTKTGLVYEVMLREPVPDEESGSCTCFGWRTGHICKHIAAAWLRFEAQVELDEALAARCESYKCITKNCVIHPDPKVVCPCCGDTVDLHKDCTCFSDPDYCKANGKPYCSNLEGCRFEASIAAETFPPLSETIEAELVELFAERELEAEPFHLG